MGSIGAIDTIKESYEFLKKNYRNMTGPIAGLILIQFLFTLVGALVNVYSRPAASGASSLFGAGSIPYANAMTGGMDALGTLGIGVFLALALGFVISILVNLALQYHISDGFYCIMRGKKQQSRMGTLLVRGVLLGIAMCLIALALAAVAGAVILLFSLVAPSILPIVIILALMVLAIVFIALFFLLSQSWIYYVLEGRGMKESFGASWNLVKANAWHYLKIMVLLAVVGLALAIGSALTCCLYVFVYPVAMVFLTILSQIAFLKSRLALDKSKQAS
jgi:hypothetical protein